MDKLKSKLNKTWFEDNTLVLLHGNFPKGKGRRLIKKHLKELGIKFTIDCDQPGITKIITQNGFWYSFDPHWGKYSNTEWDKFVRSIGQNNIVKPGDFLVMLENEVIVADNLVCENGTKKSVISFYPIFISMHLII